MLNILLLFPQHMSFIDTVGVFINPQVKCLVFEKYFHDFTLLLLGFLVGVLISACFQLELHTCAALCIEHHLQN